MMLHKRVLFVGDKPSSKNRDSDAPFVGTQSYSRLLSWIAEMDVDVNYIRIINRTDKDSYRICKIYEKFGFKIVALGKNAHDYLRWVNIEHFVLPHPSGLNRTINNKKVLNKYLSDCTKYIYQKKVLNENQDK